MKTHTHPSTSARLLLVALLSLPLTYVTWAQSSGGASSGGAGGSGAASGSADANGGMSSDISGLPSDGGPANGSDYGGGLPSDGTDQPGLPDQPDQPNPPNQPGMPRNPGTPRQPGAPIDPGVPRQPDSPIDPGLPRQPGVPDQPGIPRQPGQPDPRYPLPPRDPAADGTDLGEATDTTDGSVGVTRDGTRTRMGTSIRTDVNATTPQDNSVATRTRTGADTTADTTTTTGARWSGPGFDAEATAQQLRSTDFTNREPALRLAERNSLLGNDLIGAIDSNRAHVDADSRDAVNAAIVRAREARTELDKSISRARSANERRWDDAHRELVRNYNAYTEALRDVHEAASDGGMRFDQTTSTSARAHTGGATL